MKIAFVGLGVMGSHMARHLRAAGHDVSVFNRTQEKAVAWVRDNGGTLASSPAEAARGAAVAITMVSADCDVHEVVLGDRGLARGLRKGAVVVDHSTTSANIAVAVHRALGERGVEFVDAPVSGGEAGAKNGQLSIMMGGSAQACRTVEPVMSAYAKIARRVGPSGSGQHAKMVNQICIAGLVQALSEGLAFGQTIGLDMDAVLEVVSKGAAQSWQMDNRAKTMLERSFDFGFAVDLMRKDLGICLDEAKRVGIVLPVAALVDRFYSEVQQKGGARWDTSSLIARYQQGGKRKSGA